ncbi:hypothetical protein [Nocardia tengchongensis]|uniref:hypothetical protein n=1 Tax=Nocardia tengchongensis TaxID=2055889 RepID=UPI00364A8B93
MATGSAQVPLLFSDHFRIESEVVRDFGAFDICLVADLPIFIDPFLLFESEKPEYQELHKGIIDYLKFLRDKSRGGAEPGHLASWYTFKEVSQNWLGFSSTGNGGHGLGKKFASALYESLGDILNNFGSEDITRSSHLEKLTLVKSGVGRDCISDFTTNLIKEYLLEFTERFAREHLDASLCREFSVGRAHFSYLTERWSPRTFYLPQYLGDYVLLTPTDLLTRDETWINHADMIKGFNDLPTAVPDSELRAQIDNYFQKLLTPKPTQGEKTAAAEKTVRAYPVLIDYYIKLKEDSGELAHKKSREHVNFALELFVKRLHALAAELATGTTFYDTIPNSYAEALDRVNVFKRYVESEDGYLLLNSPTRKPYKEKEVQLLFTAIWKGSRLDVNREVNNGRGPVDFKASYGSADSSLIELKLASNTHLHRNLERQVEIYKAANNTDKAIKIIICYTEGEQKKVAKILATLEMDKEESVVVIDARNDNKPSGSNA